MDINLNITATEICGALNNLVSALVASVEQSVPSSARKTKVAKVAEVLAVTKSVGDPTPEVEPTEKVVQAVPVAIPALAVDPESALLELRAKLAALKSPANDIKFREFLAKIGVKKLTAVPAEKYAELRSFIESEMA